MDTEGAKLVAEHIAQHTEADAAMIVDGSADAILARFLAKGWTLDEKVDLIAGKRIRLLRPPAEG